MSDSIKKAELDAEMSRRELESSLDRMKGVIGGTTDKVEDEIHEVVSRADEAIQGVRQKLDVGVQKVESLMVTGQEQLDQTFTKADQFVGRAAGDFGTQIERAQQIVDRVRSRVEKVVSEVDEVAVRIESTVVGVKSDFLQSANGILDQAEGIATSFRQNLQAGTQQISQLLDRADTVLKEASDPVRFVTRNPKVGISAVLFGGIVIGLFFRKLFIGEDILPASSEPAVPASRNTVSTETRTAA